MATNGRSNIHDDAYMTDTYEVSGPLGLRMRTDSTLLSSDCASVTFDRRGRIVAVCVGLEGPKLVMLDPKTLALLAVFPLPPRDPTAGDPFTSFSGGGYFYLDDEDRAVIPTTHRHIWVVEERSGPTGDGFALERDYDVSLAVPPGDQIISAVPDWSGRIWFASQKGVVGHVDPKTCTGAGPVALGCTIESRDLKEPITNSFAVDEEGVFIVSDAAMYRFDAKAGGPPQIDWRRTYENIGVKKPGQTQAGSGTTPTLMAERYVAITDNADPMNIVVYRRESGDRVCKHPVFEKGRSATDQSLIATDRAMVTENNYGYEGPRSTMNGRSTTPGIERVDLDADRGGCHTVWTSQERAPSVVPKLSLGNGLVYTYTKPPRRDEIDAWYFTALDFRSGETVYKRLGGTGLGYNNHYAPVTIGPDGTGYVGVLGGLTLFEDTERPTDSDHGETGEGTHADGGGERVVPKGGVEAGFGGTGVGPQASRQGPRGVTMLLSGAVMAVLGLAGVGLVLARRF